MHRESETGQSLTKCVFRREIGDFKHIRDFPHQINKIRLKGLGLSKIRDVKVVGHAAITSVDIDPLEWRFILAGSSDGLIAIYDSSSTNKDNQLVGITSSCQANKASTAVVQWYPADNGLFVSSGADGQLKVWDANVLRLPVESFLLSKRIYCHHISPLNPSSVAVATDSNHIRLVDLRAGSSTHELRGHKNSVLSVKWSPNVPSILASGCLDGKALLWDVRKAKNCLMSLDMSNLKGKVKKRTVVDECMAHKGSVNGLAFSCTGQHLFTLGCFDGRIRKWDWTNGINTKTSFQPFSKLNIKIHMPLVTTEKATDVASEVLFVPVKSNILAYRMNDGQSLPKLSGHFKEVTSLAFAPTTLEMFTGSTDRAILIWDCKDHQVMSQDDDELGHKNEKRQKRVHLMQDAWSSSEDEN